MNDQTNISNVDNFDNISTRSRSLSQAQELEEKIRHEKHPSSVHLWGRFIAETLHIQSCLTSSEDFENKYSTLVSIKNKLLEIKELIRACMCHINSYFSTSQNIFASFQSLTDKASSDIKNFCFECELNHSYLSSNRQNALSNHIQHGSLHRIEQIVEIINTFDDRLTLVRDVRRELDYYKSKVDGLVSKKFSLVNQGKHETTEQIEKRERNQNLLFSKEQNFNALKTIFLTDMEYIIDNIGELIKPSIVDFLNSEVLMRDAIYNALETLDFKTQTEKPIHDNIILPSDKHSIVIPTLLSKEESEKLSQSSVLPVNLHTRNDSKAAPPVLSTGDQYLPAEFYITTPKSVEEEEETSRKSPRCG